MSQTLIILLKTKSLQDYPIIFIFILPHFWTEALLGVPFHQETWGESQPVIHKHDLATLAVIEYVA